MKNPRSTRAFVLILQIDPAADHAPGVGGSDQDADPLDSGENQALGASATNPARPATSEAHSGTPR